MESGARLARYAANRPSNPKAAPVEAVLDTRTAGLFLHLTSLPGPHGNGDMGPAAREFADFLAAARQHWWQVLPVGPTGAGDSPYSGASAFAGNPMLISLTDLAEEGLLDAGELGGALPPGQVDYRRAEKLRTEALRLATARLATGAGQHRAASNDFRRRARSWLPDYALYMALRDRHGGAPWTSWEPALARYQKDAIERARRELRVPIARYELEQFLFDVQWRRFRDHCAARGVGLIGDAPIFIAHESADVWANQAYFRLDDRGQPTHVAGVPPDYFSKTGQRWGNPLYRWKRMARDGYAWWIERFRGLLGRFDVVRLDHFIGFTRYWEVIATEKTAEHGRWLKGPGADLFEKARQSLGTLPFIAEDLGAVTSRVQALRDRYDLPGMRILQFAFGGDVQASSFLPHNYVRRSIAYTGTHDNDTIVGWFEDDGLAADSPRSPEQAAAERRNALSYLAGPGATRFAGPSHWEMIRALYGSVADTVIIPMQDVLGLDNRARMNHPGKPEGNWAWRLAAEDLTADLAEHLRQLATTYGRASPLAGAGS
ncbi:MAG: 4-alpha-glucanotransferase [Myxococcota bacterium]|nr:4-alpha-glucanotransferase [Myxococcota bacterium]